MTADAWVISIGGTLSLILLSLIAYFLKRLINQLDNVSNRIVELEKKLDLSNNHRAYLEQEVARLKRKFEILYRAFTEVDKVLYARNIKVKFETPTDLDADL